LLTVILGYVNPWTLTAFVTLPLALGNGKQMLSYQKKGIEAIANLDEATAKLQLAFSLTLAIGIIINALV
jgi:1,4-dihydroxy-2-naphthoate octaprenyltransferase